MEVRQLLNYNNHEGLMSFLGAKRPLRIILSVRMNVCMSVFMSYVIGSSLGAYCFSENLFLYL